MDSNFEPVVFGTTFESLLNGLKGRIDARGHGLLLAAGVDVRNIQPAYPVLTWSKSLRALHQAAFPSLDESEAMFQLGRSFILGLKSTLVGSAIYTMAKLIGPRRMLERMTRNSRSSNNFSETKLEQMPDGALRMIWGVRPGLESRMSEYTVSPQYMRGIITEGIVQSGAKNPKVVFEGEDPALRRCWFRIELVS